jgi:dTMP kinase
MRELLCSGVTLIVDRYAYSGAAYTAAKGHNLEKCKRSDRGLIVPDRVVSRGLDCFDMMETRYWRAPL